MERCWIRANYVPCERWLTLDEEIALLTIWPPHRQLWVGLAVYTGPRASEVDSIEWDDIDGAHRH